MRAVRMVAQLLQSYPLLTITLLVLGAYGSSLNNDFVWDDRFFILNWQQMHQPWQHLGDLLSGQVPLGQGAVFRPLRSLWYALAYQLFGHTPMGYHFMAIGLHAVASWLVFRIAQKLGLSPRVSWVITILFAWHPLATEAVVWITASFDTIGNVLFLAAFYEYLHYRSSVSPQSFRWLIVWSVGAIFTNELTLTLPILCGWYELLMSRATFFGCKAWLAAWQKTRGVWGVLGGYLLVRWATIGFVAPLMLINHSYLSTLMIGLVAGLRYLTLMVLPLPLTINHTLVGGVTNLYHKDGGILPRGQDVTIELILGWVVIGLICQSLGKWVINKKLLTFLVGAIAISLLPVIQLVPTETVFMERYAYIALSWGCVLCGLWLQEVKQQLPYLSPLGAGSLLGMGVIGLGLIYLRIPDWKSEATLWQSVQRFTPNSATAQLNLGLYYHRQGNKETGLEYLKQAVHLNPANGEHQFKLAQAYLEQQQQRQAQVHFERAIQHAAHPAARSLEIAQRLAQQQSIPLAKHFYTLTLSLDPANVLARRQLEGLSR